MEAIEAVSQAANILQFTIFAKDCYVEIREIRESAKGLTKKEAKLLNSTSRREKMLSSISVGLSSLEGELTPTERQIRDIAERCQLMASDLREDIESRSVKNRSNVLKMAFNVAIRRHKIPEVDEKIAKWEDLKKDLFRLLNIHISQQQSGVKLALAELVEQTRHLGMAHSDDLDRMKSDILDAISKESESQEAALNWLSKDDGVYWVTGYPGPGKSTFMKYLSHHTKMHQKLVQWAAPKTLVTASFYFWFSGTALQKSQEGLLRSLLFQILRQCPCLIPGVCKSRWSSDLGIPWTRSELIDTLKSLALKSTSTKFFFLIDGLDEYQDYANPQGSREGGVSAHVRDIIEVINDLADLQDIKLCVSSRPWPAFENAFGQATRRKLYVHNENREDIGRYIRERFTSSPAYQKSLIPPKDLQTLSNSMVEDSRGVFLWVSLVVESLLQGLENGDRVDELRKRFEETPKTLHAMFERMLDSVEERYHEQAAQILQVAFHARAPMYVAVYSFIGDDELLLEGDPKPWREDDCIHKSKSTEDRLKVRCPDLIKIKGNPSTMTTAQRMTKHQVEFLHRTVKDFLSLEDTQKMLQDRIRESFDPMRFISKALLAHIRGAEISGNQAWSPTSWEMFQLLDELTYYVFELEQTTKLPQIELLDKLRETIAKQTGNRDFLLDGDSFFGVMAQKDMYLYVKENLPQALHGPGAPLLGSVLFPRWQRPRRHADGLPRPSVEMVELLLKHGAKTRELSKDRKATLWSQYMARIYGAQAELRGNARLRDTHLYHSNVPRARRRPQD
ncbi:NACHT domain-containing protein [Fusarium keratoplasticum]|nr:NACHT domain-containing protein [Fusarium keratoplasticum]